MKSFKFNKAKWIQDMEGTWVSFLVDKKDALELTSELKDKQYVCEVKEYREKRSLDANAFYWTLAGKLSAKLRIPPEDIYRQHIKDIGDNYDILPLKDTAVDRFIRVWRDNGIGWIVDILGPSKHDGYINVMAYYGSRTYDKVQMSRLIDLMVEDCKENGVEVMSDDEIARINSMWKEEKNG